MEALPELERMKQMALILDGLQKKIYDESLELSPLERALLAELAQLKIIDLYEEAKKKKLLPKKTRGGQKGAIYKSKGVDTRDKYWQVYCDVQEETENFCIEKTKLFIDDLCKEMSIEFGYTEKYSFMSAIDSGYHHWFADLCDDGCDENKENEYINHTDNEYYRLYIEFEKRKKDRLKRYENGKLTNEIYQRVMKKHGYKNISSITDALQYVNNRFDTTSNNHDILHCEAESTEVDKLVLSGMTEPEDRFEINRKREARYNLYIEGQEALKRLNGNLI